MTVERLENEMSALELQEWADFYELEPFGNEERMADQRNALSCMVQNKGSELTFDKYLLYGTIEEEQEYNDWESKLIRAMTKI